MKMHIISLVVGIAVLAGASNAMGTPLFSNQRSGTGCGAGAQACTSFQIDDQTAATSNVNTHANVGMAGLAYDANNDILYGIKNGASSELFTIDQASGAATKIGNTGINDAVGLAYDNATGTMWGSTNGVGGGPGSFYRINPTNASTLFSVTGFQERLDGLAYGNGNLFVQQEITTGTIFVVNQTTGTGTAIPNQALPKTASWQGLAFQNGLLYAADCCAGGNGELWSVDPNTGATASVGSNDTFRLQSLAPTTGSGSMGNIDDFEWNTNRSGDWNVGGNWNPGGGPPGNSTAPNRANHTATFGNAIESDHTVFANSDVSVRGIVFDNTNTYIVSGPASVSLVQGTKNGLPANSIINVANGTHQFQLNVELQNNTDVDVTSGATLEFNNRLFLNGNTLTKTGDGTLSINNNFDTGASGSVDCQAGTCNGTGTVGGNLSSSDGVVAPGNSPGILSVDGNYTQSAGGTLEIELASNGGVAGTDHDRLAVTLAASLDGTLDLQLDGGYTPTIGDSFAGIVTSGALSGQFATTSNVVIDGRRGVAVTYTGTTVDAQIGLRGNTDIASGDIDVDTSDLTTSIINFTSAGGAGKTWADGDMDGDGDVDTSDLTTSIINFTSALSSGASAVPEPTSLLLLSLGVMLLAGRRAGHRGPDNRSARKHG